MDRNGFSHAFYNKTLNGAETAAYLKTMASIKWEKFTDNFFCIYCQSNMDLFTDVLAGPCRAVGAAL